MKSHGSRAREGMLTRLAEVGGVKEPSIAKHPCAVPEQLEVGRAESTWTGDSGYS